MDTAEMLDEMQVMVTDLGKMISELNTERTNLKMYLAHIGRYEDYVAWEAHRPDTP